MENCRVSTNGGSIYHHIKDMDVVRNVQPGNRMHSITGEALELLPETISADEIGNVTKTH